MKCLSLVPVTFGLFALSEVMTTTIFKFLDTFSTYSLRQINNLVATKNFKLKYEVKDEKDAQLFIKSYFLVFTQNKNLDFCYL